MSDRDLSDYNEVEHRIQEFREKHPQHSLQGDWRMERAGDQWYIAYRAEAYRTPDDPRPGVGSAWEVVPGRTPFTRGSELQNAETSAWGRAIIAVGGADAKKGIASRQEVQLRRAERVPVTGAEHERLRYGTVERTPDDKPTQRSRAVDNPGDNPWQDQPPGEFDIGHPEDKPGSIDGQQIKAIAILFRQRGIVDDAVRHGMLSDFVGTRTILSVKQLSRAEAAHVIKRLQETRDDTA